MRIAQEEHSPRFWTSPDERPKKGAVRCCAGLDAQVEVSAEAPATEAPLGLQQRTFYFLDSLPNMAEKVVLTVVEEAGQSLASLEPRC